MTICAGIDLSLTSPSICINLSEERFGYDACVFSYLTDNKKRVINLDNISGSLFPDYNSQFERYENISIWAIQALQQHGITRVFIENYSYASAGRVFHIAENTGILKYLMWKNNIKIVTVPPTVVKMIATGKGNSKKEDMNNAFIKETGVNLKQITGQTEKQWNPSSDIVDSYYICKYGALEYTKVVE